MQHLLVVDDEPAMRESVARSLRLERYQVSEAKDGREAIAELQEISFDLVIMDLAMPHMDGLEAIKVIREAKEQVPILVLTAKAGVDERVEGLEAGADDYLVKPFALKELLARVNSERGLPSDHSETIDWCFYLRAADRTCASFRLHQDQEGFHCLQDQLPRCTSRRIRPWQLAAS